MKALLVSLVLALGSASIAADTVTVPFWQSERGQYFYDAICSADQGCLTRHSEGFYSALDRFLRIEEDGSVVAMTEQGDVVIGQVIDKVIDRAVKGDGAWGTLTVEMNEGISVIASNETLPWAPTIEDVTSGNIFNRIRVFRQILIKIRQHELSLNIYFNGAKNVLYKYYSEKGAKLSIKMGAITSFER